MNESSGAGAGPLETLLSSDLKIWTKDNTNPQKSQFEAKTSAEFKFLPLLEAVKCGDHAEVVVLLDVGANFDAVDTYSRSVTCWAALKGHLSIVRLLRDRGADMNIRDISGWTPFLGQPYPKS